MSKFLKIIVNLVVLLAIVIAAALLVPPFAGVDTVMNDSTETDTNLPVGSVAYGRTVKAKELEKGDKIIYSEGSSNYIYEIVDMDASAGAYKVKDVYNSKSDEESVTIQKSISKVVVTVPFIGYAAIALQSKEGLIVVGLGIVFLIILFILSELCRKDDEEEDEDAEDEEDGDEDEEEDDEEEEDEDEELSWRERRRRKKEEKRLRKLEKRRQKEAEEEDEDEDEEQEETEASEEETKEPDDFDLAMQDAMSSIAMGVAQVSEPKQEEKAGETAEEAIQTEEEALASADETKAEDEPAKNPVQETEEEEEKLSEAKQEEVQPELSEEPQLPVNPNAIPKAPSVSELLEKAKAAGEEPKVQEDKENDVTLLDYSDLL